MDSMIIKNIEKYTGEISRSDLLKLEKEPSVKWVIHGGHGLDLEIVGEEFIFSIFAEKFGHIFKHMNKKKAVR